ncbi:MAG: DUF4143 domain-containing protein [Candidatus Methanoplasma sp.]|jgi:predicted AAA+ superfamily ATPase|nr:DUF4143 domain-containing protein [Candidatus Methanoplasma sp.]
MNEYEKNEDVRTLYRPRVVDARVEEYLSSFGGVQITGPKWCGKTWTGLCHSKSAVFISDERSRKKAILSPEEVLRGERPRLIDEWQDVPNLWDVARNDIDREGASGMYLFTGSSTPPENSTSHTGTGRFARVMMRPMSLFESGDSTGGISLSGLFGGAVVPTSTSAMSYRKAVELICRGGWPSGLKTKNPHLPAQYLESVIWQDMSRVDGRKRSRSTMDSVLRSLARNTATSVKKSTMAADMSRDGKKTSEQTVSSYVDVLKRLFVIDEQEPWNPRLRSKSRVRSTAKKHFIDPSLAVAALGADAEAIIDDPGYAGFLFESLCYRDLSVYASALGGKVKYFGDSNKFEIDQIIELGNGRWGAAEVKLGGDELDKAASNLLKLKDKVDGAKTPSFLMILTATGELSYTRKEDGVAVVPVDLLGP